jgi:hypothetical protein
MTFTMAKGVMVQKSITKLQTSTPVFNSPAWMHLKKFQEGHLDLWPCTTGGLLFPVSVGAYCKALPW